MLRQSAIFSTGFLGARHADTKSARGALDLVNTPFLIVRSGRVRTVKAMPECVWLQEGICVNEDSPMFCGCCPVEDEPGVCGYEDREDSDSDGLRI